MFRFGINSISGTFHHSPTGQDPEWYWRKFRQTEESREIWESFAWLNGSTTLNRVSAMVDDWCIWEYPAVTYDRYPGHNSEGLNFVEHRSWVDVNRDGTLWVPSLIARTAMLLRQHSL